jgi:hypothetical protein
MIASDHRASLGAAPVRAVENRGFRRGCCRWRRRLVQSARQPGIVCLTSCSVRQWRHGGDGDGTPAIVHRRSDRPSRRRTVSSRAGEVVFLRIGAQPQLGHRRVPEAYEDLVMPGRCRVRLRALAFALRRPRGPDTSYAGIETLRPDRDVSTRSADGRGMLRCAA